MNGVTSKLTIAALPFLLLGRRRGRRPAGLEDLADRLGRARLPPARASTARPTRLETSPTPRSWS